MTGIELDEIIDRVAKAKGVDVEQMSEFAQHEFVLETTLEIELLRRDGRVSGAPIEFDLERIKREFPSLRFLVKKLEEKI